MNWTETTRSYAIWNDQEIKGFFGNYRWLSNFEPALVYWDGILYPSVENAYQAAKVIPLYRERFRTCSPAESKQLWKTVTTLYSAEAWDKVKYEIMAALVFDKFFRNFHLRAQLLETGDKFLEETNHWNDIYWGVCRGKGANNLGKLLMKTREFWK